MDPMTCGNCGRPHDRCAGHNRAGGPCQQWPMKGQRVCKNHGGKSPQALAAAAQRQAEQAAAESLTRLWPGLSVDRRVTDPLGGLEQLAGALEHMVDQVGRKVNELQNYATGKDLAQLRAEIVLFERLLKTLQSTLRDMASLGIAERYVELEKAKVDIVMSAFLKALEGAGLDEERRDRVVVLFRGALPGAAGPAVVAGEVTR